MSEKRYKHIEIVLSVHECSCVDCREDCIHSDLHVRALHRCRYDCLQSYIHVRIEKPKIECEEKLKCEAHLIVSPRLPYVCIKTLCKAVIIDGENNNIYEALPYTDCDKLSEKCSNWMSAPLNTPTLYILIFTASPKYKDIANFIPNYKLGGIVKHRYGQNIWSWPQHQILEHSEKYPELAISVVTDWCCARPAWSHLLHLAWNYCYRTLPSNTTSWHKGRSSCGCSGNNTRRYPRLW